jgi:hypothetical protein
LIQSV